MDVKHNGTQQSRTKNAKQSNFCYITLPFKYHALKAQSLLRDFLWITLKKDRIDYQHWYLIILNFLTLLKFFLPIPKYKQAKNLILSCVKITWAATNWSQSHCKRVLRKISFWWKVGESNRKQQELRLTNVRRFQTILTFICEYLLKYKCFLRYLGL